MRKRFKINPTNSNQKCDRSLAWLGFEIARADFYEIGRKYLASRVQIPAVALLF